MPLTASQLSSSYQPTILLTHTQLTQNHHTSHLTNNTLHHHKSKTNMPSQTTTTLQSPIPRRRSPLLATTSNTNQTPYNLSLSLSSSLSNKAKSPYTFILREDGNDYSPPAPPPPSPVNFPVESWSTALSHARVSGWREPCMRFLGLNTTKYLP